MHTHINKYILAHPFLSTGSKLSSQFRSVDRRNHPNEKEKELFSCFPFQNKNKIDAYREGRQIFAILSPFVYIFSFRGPHREHIYRCTVFSPPTETQSKQASKFASRSSRQSERETQQEQDKNRKKRKRMTNIQSRQLFIYLHLNCQNYRVTSERLMMSNTYFLPQHIRFDFCYQTIVPHYFRFREPELSAEFDDRI